MANNLIAPNGKPSNLNAEQYALVRTPAFKAWFGDWENEPQNASKVVDDNGEPKVMYHGSRGDFNIFSNDNSNKLTWTEGGLGFYFTSYSISASAYGTKIIAAFINSRSIKKSDESEHAFVNINQLNKLYQEDYDSIYFDGQFTKTNGQRGWKEDELVVFESNQIKLADGSNTTFDSGNPDIRYAEGGEIEFDYLKEADDEEVEIFFDSDCNLLRQWTEGVGRGITPYMLYTNGTQYLLESEEYGFDGYNSPKYHFIQLKKAFEHGGLTAKETIQSLPTELRERYLKLWDIPQRKDYHPEGNTLKHAVVVLNRAIKKYPNDKDIIAAALFHDIGKDKVFEYHKTTGEPTAYGHEEVSAELVIEYQDWVSDFGADVDCVYFLVKNHMKAHKLNEMRQSKQDAIKASPYYDKLMKLESIDKGGIEYADGGEVYSLDSYFEENRKEIERQLDEKNIDYSFSGFANTNWGTSIYYTIGGLDGEKWRFSDHSVSNINRLRDERHFPLPIRYIGKKDGTTIKTFNDNILKDMKYEDGGYMAEGGNIWGLEQSEIEEQRENSRLVDALYQAKRKMYDSYIEETEEAIAEYYQAKKMYDDFISSIEERKDSIRRINNLEYILDSEKESYEDTRYTYEHKELYEKDPRLAAIESAKENIVWINSNDSKDARLKQGESEEEIEESIKRLKEQYSQNLKDLTYDLMVNPISPIGKMAHGGTTNKNNTKMIHKQHLNLKPIQKIDVGDTYLLKEDVFDSNRNHIGTRYCTIKVSQKHPLDNYELEVIECEGDAKKFPKGTILNRDRKHIISNGKMISEGEKNAAQVKVGLDDIYMGDSINYDGKNYEVGGLSDCRTKVKIKLDNNESNVDIDDVMDRAVLIKRGN